MINVVFVVKVLLDVFLLALVDEYLLLFIEKLLQIKWYSCYYDTVYDNDDRLLQISGKQNSKNFQSEVKNEEKCNQNYR